MIVTVGSINMDLVVRVPHHPESGETVLGGDYATHAGGKGANQAVAAARLGAQVRMFGALGDDSFGPILAGGLAAEGIDTSWVRRLSGPSGVAFIAVDGRGRNRIIVAPGANSRVTPESLDLAGFEGAHVVLMQLEVPLAAVREAARLGRQAGAATVLNAAPATALTGDDLCDVDILMVNELEAATILGQAGPVTVDQARRRAAELCLLGPGVVITLGDKGAVYAIGGAEGHQEAFLIDAVDTTAAGDAFAGAFAVALAEGLDSPQATRLGCAAGALAATREGAQPSLPRRSQLESWLQRQEQPR